MESHDAVDELHLKDYLDVLARRREIVILFFVMTVLVVTIGSFMMKPVYRATATILVDPESPNVLTTTGAVELQSQNYYSYREYYQSQTELLTSYALAKKVFDEFGLGKDESYARAKEPVKKFLKTIKVEPVRDTRLLRLNVDNNDPALAAKIANRIAELYVLRNLYYISKNELMNLMKNEYLKLEAKMSEYEKVFKAGHPEMVKLKKEMAEMTDRIDQEKRSVYNFDNIEEYMGRGSRHALAGFKANNISIQDVAEVPVKPIKPKKLLNIVLAVVFGLFGGVALAFFFEYLDDSARTVEDIERSTNWPFLGSVPDINRSAKLKEAEKDVFVNIRPKDPISEIYRIIRTRMLFASVDEKPVKCVLVTSPGPQEGKTVTLCNLGIAISQNAQRVLVVDADMRKPRLHEAFGSQNAVGLSSFLSGQAQFDSVIQRTLIDRVSLVSGGVVPPNPSELLASHKMQEFIDKARTAFDFVLLDTPPVGMLTDAMVVSGLTDGVIVVVESGKTSKRMLARIRQLMEHVKARMIGMIFNKAPAGPSSYYYYSHYYGESGKKKRS
jgi:capsular exopolysaccharide synthesis family protein